MPTVLLAASAPGDAESSGAAPTSAVASASEEQESATEADAGSTRRRWKARRPQNQLQVPSWTRKPRQLVPCSSIEELTHQVDELKTELHDLDVRCSGGQGHAADHPILELIRARVAAGTRPSRHGDGARLGLAVEGGGMRGCVSAGMVTALHRLGAADAFDAVYGSSAGCLVGAYFISRQTNGTAVYHDVLPEAGARFLDKSRLVAALGLDISLFRWDWWNLRQRRAAAQGESTADATDAPTPEASPADAAADAAASKGGVMVFNLDFLMTTVVGRLWPLDWTSFWANNRHQPLNVVVSGLLSMDSHTLTSAKGHFATLPELARCMRASMLVPGMTGPLVTFPVGWNPSRPPSPTHEAPPPPSLTTATPLPPPPLTAGEGGWGAGGYAADAAALAAVDFPYAKGHQPFADALIFEPMPYRSAAADGCTHVVVLRTRPDGSQVLGKKAGIYERRIARKYFEEFHTIPHVSQFLIQLRHLRIYAEDVLSLAKGGLTGAPVDVPRGGAGEGKRVHLLAIAPFEGAGEVNQLEMDRAGLLKGCRDGFAAAYEALATPQQRARDGGVGGAALARSVFPDSILTSPVDFDATFWQPGRAFADDDDAAPPSPSPSEVAAAAVAAAAAPAEALWEGGARVGAAAAALDASAAGAAAVAGAAPVAAAAAPATAVAVAAAGRGKRARLGRWLRRSIKGRH